MFSGQRAISKHWSLELSPALAINDPQCCRYTHSYTHMCKQIEQTWHAMGL